MPAEPSEPGAPVATTPGTDEPARPAARGAVRRRAREDGPSTRRAPGQPGLGPYTGPAVVLGLLAAVLVLGLLISLVGAVRSPDDVSNSATVLGTFPIDPDAPGIPAGPAGQPDDTIPPEGVPGGAPEDPSTTTPGGTVPEGDGAAVVDPFDGDLAGWETVGDGWEVADGALVVPEGSVADPALALRPGDATAGIGAEVEVPATDAGLVVGFTDPGSYVAAVAVPDYGGWRLEVWQDGEVTTANPLAPSEPGTQAQLAVADGQARLLVDGEEVATLPAPDAPGDRVGFVGRGEAGGRWAALLSGPGS